MSDFDRDDIRARAEAATPGPWMVIDPNEGSGHAPFWQVVNDAFLNPIGDEDSPWLAVELHTGVRADAEFIAHARSDIPALLARLAEVEGERDEAQSRLDGLLAARTDRQQATAALAAENARLRRSVASWTETARVYAQNAADWETKADTMRPVVEAAKAWVAGMRELNLGSTAVDILGEDFAAAVDALQDGPSAPLSSPLSPSQPELVPDSTDGVGEQGEAQGEAKSWVDANGDEICYTCSEKVWYVKEGWVCTPECSTYLDSIKPADREQIPGSSIHSEGGSGREETDPNRAIAEKLWGEVSAEHGLPPYDLPISAVATYAADPPLPPEVWAAAVDPDLGPGEMKIDGKVIRYEPADPPWLKKAIETAARSGSDELGYAEGLYTAHHGLVDWPTLADMLLRAALPHITGGVLEEARDDLRRRADRWVRDGDQEAKRQAGMIRYAASVLDVRASRAARQVTS